MFCFDACRDAGAMTINATNTVTPTMTASASALSAMAKRSTQQTSKMRRTLGSELIPASSNAGKETLRVWRRERRGLCIAMGTTENDHHTPGATPRSHESSRAMMGISLQATCALFTAWYQRRLALDLRVAAIKPIRQFRNCASLLIARRCARDEETCRRVPAPTDASG